MLVVVLVVVMMMIIIIIILVSLAMLNSLLATYSFFGPHAVARLRTGSRRWFRESYSTSFPRLFVYRCWLLLECAHTQIETEREEKERRIDIYLDSLYAGRPLTLMSFGNLFFLFFSF